MKTQRFTVEIHAQDPDEENAKRIRQKIEDALDEMLTGMGGTFKVSINDLPELKKCKAVVHYQ